MNLHEALLSIEVSRDNSVGICNNIDAEVAWKIVEELMVSWPEFSGDADYPVPSCGSSSPVDAYVDAQNEGSLWDESTVYGAARWRLLRFMIEQTK